MLLEGKVAIVTGGTRGIGYETVRQFLLQGAKVALFGSRKETVDVAIAKLKEENSGFAVIGLYPKLTSEVEVKSAFDSVKNEFGKIDVLINNAGISSHTKLLDFSEDEYDKIADLNIKSVFVCSKVAVPYLTETKGVILNTSSMVSRDGQPSGVMYPASKYAVNGITQSLSRELAPLGIRVNAVAPGITETEMLSALPKNMIEPLIKTIPLGRIGTPTDIANAFVFLASDMVLVLSSQWKDFIETTLGIHEHVKVLYNPIISLPLVGKRYEKKKYILFAGTVDKRKGYHDLIVSFSMCSMSFPDWRLLIAGNGEIDEGKSLAYHLGIADKVKFLGWITGDEKDSVFGEASIYCLPSYAEGFPMSVLDAWAYGLPVVCTPVGGIMDVAKDGENIMLFNPGDTTKLSEELSLLMGDIRLRESIALHSQTLSESIFNLSRINSQLGDLYKQLLGE